MNDTQTAAGPSSVPSDPAMAAADPAMFLPMNTAWQAEHGEPEAAEAGA